MTDRELLQQALEQLEHAMRYWDYRHIVTALRERLKQEDDRPSYWYAQGADGRYVVGRGNEEIAWGLAGETARQVVEALREAK